MPPSSEHSGVMPETLRSDGTLELLVGDKSCQSRSDTLCTVQPCYESSTLLGLNK